MRRGIIVAIAAVALACGLRRAAATTAPRRPVDAELVHLQRAQRRAAEDRRALLAAVGREVQDQLRATCPSQADQQREQLVRRLGAEDASMDLLGLDVVWTGEFANAGWIAPVPADTRAESSPRTSSTPCCRPRASRTSSTRSRSGPTRSCCGTARTACPTPPKTWDEMIDMAEKIGPAKGRIQVQANRYEGLVVWSTSSSSRPARRILAGPTKVELDEAPTEEGARDHRPPLALDRSRPPNLTTSNEDTARLGFEAGNSTLHDQLPVRLPLGEGQRARRSSSRWAPRSSRPSTPGKPSSPPIGGINLGVSAYSKHNDLAFEATECLVKPENQLEVTTLGRPAAGARGPLRRARDQEGLSRASPTRSATRSRTPAPRPSESPAYQDLSLAIQRAVHPTTKIDPRGPRRRLRQAARQRREGRQARGPAVSTAAPPQVGEPAVGGAAAAAGRRRRATARRPSASWRSCSARRPSS